MVDMQGASNVSYTSGVQQSFKQKIAYMAADEMGGNVSIFMNAMDSGKMYSEIDGLLKESNGTIPDNYECQSFVDKLLDFVKALFNQNPAQKQTFEDFMNKDNEKTTDASNNDTEIALNFSFEATTDTE